MFERDLLILTIAKSSSYCAQENELSGFTREKFQNNVYPPIKSMCPFTDLVQTGHSPSSGEGLQSLQIQLSHLPLSKHHPERQNMFYQKLLLQGHQLRGVEF